MTGHRDAPPDGSIGERLAANAARYPGQIAYAFTDPSPPLTWQDLLDGSRAVAGFLANRGIRQGESVLVVQPNGHDAVLAFFGCVLGGFRATMVNLVAGDAAIRYAAEHSEARIAFVGPKQTEMFVRTAPAGIELAALASALADARSFPPCSVDPDDDALLMYTSGTTGTPKGVIHSHSSLLAGGWTTATAHRLTTSDVGYCVLPIYHINGLCVTVMGNLVSAGTLVMAPGFSTSRFWRDVESHDATWFSVVPTIVSHLLHGHADPSGPTRSRIRFGRSASAPLAPEIQTSFENRFGIPIVETMGLTETAAQILSNPLPPGRRKIGSPGIAFGNEVEIRTADGCAVAEGAEGEIVVRGPNVMSGYFRNPAATAAAFTADGWFRTGDLGRVDRDGYIFVTGRLKELIIKGGENIAPREIDEALYAHPDVIEAAAFGIPCKIYGERVEAAAKLRADSAATAEELREICRKRLGDFKTPERVHVLDDLPKGPSGKIQRLVVARLVAAGR